MLFIYTRLIYFMVLLTWFLTCFDWTRDRRLALLFSTIKIHVRMFDGKRDEHISQEWIFNDFSIFAMIENIWIFIKRISKKEGGGGEQLTKIQQIKSVTLLISDRFKLKIEKRDKSIFSHIPMSPASFFTNNNHGKIGCSTMSDQTINYPRDNYIYFWPASLR